MLCFYALLLVLILSYLVFSKNNVNGLKTHVWYGKISSLLNVPLKQLKGHFKIAFISSDPQIGLPYSKVPYHVALY